MENIKYKTITEERIEEMKTVVVEWLMDYMDYHIDYWRESMGDETSTYAKVRVEWENDLGDLGKYTFGYDKYYMAHVNGNYEYSIENMIFMLMMNLGYYEEILMPEDYELAVKVATETPDYIYQIDSWNEEKSEEYREYAQKADEFIMDIMYSGVQAVGERLCKEFGLETVSEYENLECQEEEEEEK